MALASRHFTMVQEEFCFEDNGGNLVVKDDGPIKSSGNYRNSVLIMTKFPDPAKPNPQDANLLKVINSVAVSLHENGYCPRIAKQSYQDWLWGNVAQYLLGCGLGVAIIENQHTQELNPNIALEWGWMKAMCKPVLYLKEASFDKERADWAGLICYPFEWLTPEPGVMTAVRQFFQTRSIGLPEKLRI